MSDNNKKQQAFKILGYYKNAWKKQFPEMHLNDCDGIYILTRTQDFAYVGQSVHILQRLAEHSMGCKQHVDLSLKAHKFYDKDTNPYGWKVAYIKCPKKDLDTMEQKYIALYKDKGYDLLNKTAGGQGEGKVPIAEFTRNGYKKGVAYGEEKTMKKLKEFFDKYLDVTIKGKEGKIKERKLEEFKKWLSDK